MYLLHIVSQETATECPPQNERVNQERSMGYMKNPTRREAKGIPRMLKGGLKKRQRQHSPDGRTLTPGMCQWGRQNIPAAILWDLLRSSWTYLTYSVHALIKFLPSTYCLDLLKFLISTSHPRNVLLRQTSGSWRKVMASLDPGNSEQPTCPRHIAAGTQNSFHSRYFKVWAHISQVSPWPCSPNLSREGSFYTFWKSKPRDPLNISSPGNQGALLLFIPVKFVFAVKTEPWFLWGLYMSYKSIKKSKEIINTKVWRGISWGWREGAVSGKRNKEGFEDTDTILLSLKEEYARVHLILFWLYINVLYSIMYDTFCKKKIILLI